MKKTITILGSCRQESLCSCNEYNITSIKEDLRMDSICQRIIGLPNIGIRTFPGNRLEDILACRTARLPNPMN